MDRQTIAEARKKAGKTQADVAKHLGINQSTYSGKEQRNDFTLLEMKMIKKYIGHEIFDRVENANLLLHEPASGFGKASDDHRRLLVAMNKLLGLQRAGIAIQAEMFAEMKGISVEEVIEKIKTKYRDLTGESIDL